MLRFAAGRPTQATAIDDVTVEIAVRARRPRGPRVDQRRRRRVARATAPRARGSAARRGRGQRRRQLSRASDPDRDAARRRGARRRPPRSSTPAAGGAAPGRRRSRWPPPRASRRTASGRVAEQEQAWATRGGGRRRERSHRRLHEGDLHRAERPQRLRAPRRPSRRASSTPRALRRAGRGARRLRPASRPSSPPGEYPVVFEAARGGLAARPARRARLQRARARRGPRRAGRAARGARGARPAINLSDSPRSPRTLPRSFDAEGTPKAPLPLIQDGVAHGVAHDIRSAALAGAAQSTGHALAPGRRPRAARTPPTWCWPAAARRDEAELCAPVERGVYVTRLWYANVVRPKETLITAVTRDGTFLIEDGRITRPLRDLRLTDSVLGILARTQALGARPEADERRRVLRPPLRLRRGLPAAAGGAACGSRALGCSRASRWAALRSSAARSRSPRTAARSRSSSGSGCARPASRRRTGRAPVPTPKAPERPASLPRVQQDRARSGRPRG